MLEPTPSALWMAFGLSMVAGLSTAVGGGLALVLKQGRGWLLSLGMGFAAGIMIYVSFGDLMGEAHELLETALGESVGGYYAFFSLLGGMLLVAGIDLFLPMPEHIVERQVGQPLAQVGRVKLLRLGLLMSAVLALHNLPEGMATFITSLHDAELGVKIALAIAIHNIPEGIAVAVPVFYATGNRSKAFGYAFLSGLAEPLGALMAYLVLAPFLTPTVLGVMFGVVAGVMIFISLDQLLPAAYAYGNRRLANMGLLVGVAAMGLSGLLAHAH